MTLSGIDKITYQKLSADSTVLAQGTITNGTLQLDEGSYNLVIFAWDKAGNSTQVQINNLQVDHTPPQLTPTGLNLSQDGSVYLTGNGILPVTFDASDPSSNNIASGVSNLRYWILQNRDDQLGAGQVIPLLPDLSHYAQSISLNGVAGQAYYLAFAVEDAAGNRSEVANIRTNHAPGFTASNSECNRTDELRLQ